MEAGQDHDPIAVEAAADSETAELLDRAEQLVRQAVQEKHPGSLQELHQLVAPESIDAGLVSLAILELLSRDELELTEDREPRLT
jgi:hypothetical protein